MPKAAHFENLISALGTGALGNAIFSAADEITGIDEIFAYCVTSGYTPQRIVSGGCIGSAQSRAMAYSRDYHTLDPLARSQHGVSRGLRFARLSAKDVPDRDYRRECFEMPGLADKVSFSRMRDGKNYVLNFYRRQKSRPLDIPELSSLAELCLPLLRKHNEITGADGELSLLKRVENRLAMTFPNLSSRENQVCARTLIGMTAKGIALDLEICETSVLTYRRRAYERYNLSGTQSMIASLI